MDDLVRTGSNLALLVGSMLQSIGDHIAEERPWTTVQYLELVQTIDAHVEAWQTAVTKVTPE